MAYVYCPFPFHTNVCVYVSLAIGHPLIPNNVLYISCREGDFFKTKFV